ncbi:MAG: GNAT family N-acetyltransferase [Jatrophihabitantaceae bacterium]
MLTGELIELRAITDDDEPVLYRIAAELDTWEERSPSPPRPLTRAAHREREAKFALTDDTRFVVSFDGQAVGTVSLFHEDLLARHAEVGIALLPEARGKGYGTDALRLVVEFAFTTRNLRRVYLSALASNAAALASYRKVGFVEEGRHREHCWVRGRYEDEVAMGLLRSEWRADVTTR